MLRRPVILAAAGLLAAPAIVRAQDILKSSKASYRLVTLSRDLVQPWSIAFLPDGRLLVTERPGRLRVFADGRLERMPLAGVPKVYASGQGACSMSACIPSSRRTGCFTSPTRAKAPAGPRPRSPAPNGARAGCAM